MNRVLFVLPSAEVGGTTVSLLNLLGYLKNYGVDYDLFLMSHEGELLNRVKNIPGLLAEEPVISSVLCDRTKLQEKGKLALFIRSVFALMRHLVGRKKVKELFFSTSAAKLSGKYDVVVAYQEGAPSSYVKYIKAKKKISWFHTDFKTYLSMNDKEELRGIYRAFDEIVCVTEQSRRDMMRELGLEQNHIHKIFNVIPEELIRSRAENSAENIRTSEYTFVSMGRLCKTKGFDRAISVADQLRRENIDFSWYILGSGEDHAKLKDQINELQLEKYVILLGMKENPFPYIKQADCFVLTSRYEAQPMVANEALTLGIPVISTSFASVSEVISDGENGLIVENSTQGILKGIHQFTSDPHLRIQITDGAKKFQYGNVKIVESVLKLIASC